MREDIVERLQRIERQINLIRNQKAKTQDGLSLLDARIDQLELEFNQLSDLLAVSLNQPETPAVFRENTSPTPTIAGFQAQAQSPSEPNELEEAGLKAESGQSSDAFDDRIPVMLRKESAREAEERESILGTRWLSRIGIVALLFGIAMALAYTFPNFSNGLKIFTGFVVAGLLYGGGHWLYKQTAVLGRILQGGGLSVGYASLFSIFFMPQVQLLDAPQLGVFALFCYVAGMLWMAHRLNSQTVAILSTAFGYFTAPYAGDQGIQLILAGILSLATVFVTRLHPDWKAMPKINWAGAMTTYSSASFAASKFSGGLPNSAYQAYLIYTALLFHAVSLLRGPQGDMMLGQLNTLAFYLLFWGRTPDVKPAGLLEISIAAVQYGSLWLLRKLDRETDCTALCKGLVINAVLLAGVATWRYFGGDFHSTVFAAEALVLALMVPRSKYRNLLTIFSYAGLAAAYLSVWETWHALQSTALFANALWITLVTLYLEYGPFRKQSGGSNLFLIILAHLLMLSAILKVTDVNLHTVGILLESFVTLGAGFVLRRKVYRMVGLGVLFSCGGFSLLIDLIRLETMYKILLFMVLGAGLLAGSYGYSWLSRRLPEEVVQDVDQPISSEPERD
jgi:uncharacterized membrane protein